MTNQKKESGKKTPAEASVEASNAEEAKTVDGTCKEEKPICGIIMPISDNDRYRPGHWINVKLMISEAIELAGFTAKLVSEANESGIIQKTIAENIYLNPMVVCDVSDKNPNVMLELGLRLAFDKPVIILKDEKTNYSFDTSPIEHLLYNSELMYHDIKNLIFKLTDKIKYTYDKSVNDPNYSTYLRHLIQFVPKKVESQEVGGSDTLLLLSRMDRIENALIKRIAQIEINYGSIKKDSSVKDKNYLLIIDDDTDMSILDFINDNLTKLGVTFNINHTIDRIIFDCWVSDIVYLNFKALISTMEIITKNKIKCEEVY